MRIEDAGSLTPAADLMAFSIALVLTLGVLLTLETGSDRTVQSDFDAAHHLTSIPDWTILDIDSDGIIEIPDGEVFHGDYPFDDGTDIRVEISWDNGSIGFIIHDGKVGVGTSEYRIGSAIHSITVTVDTGGNLRFGRLSVSMVEVMD